MGSNSKPSIADKAPTFTTTNGDVIAYVEELHEHASPQHAPWLAIAARLLRAACPDVSAAVTRVAVNFSLDPLVPSGPEPLQRCFTLATQGSDPDLDRLAVLIQVLKECEPDERAACLAYITSRFMGEAP